LSQAVSEYQNFLNQNHFFNLPNINNQRLYDELVNEVINFIPNSIFDFLGQELLKVVLLSTLQDNYIYNLNGVSLGFVYQRNYQGLMASKINEMRPKRGLFDFKIHFSQLLNTTHYQVFNEIINQSKIDNCKKIWDGRNFPDSITSDYNEQLVLHKLMLMMFEQEVNWGDEQFQAFSAFSPSKGGEPRDMLMGFIDMMYNGGQIVSVDNIPDWKTNWSGKKMTPIFGGKNKYAEYPKNLKDTHFEPYRGKAAVGGMMVGGMRSLFLRTSNLFLVNS
jgi:hypothetical protein